MTGAYLPACDDCISSGTDMSWVRSLAMRTAPSSTSLAALANSIAMMLTSLRQKHWFFIDAFIRCDGNLVFALILGMLQASVMLRPLSPFQPGSTQP